MEGKREECEGNEGIAEMEELGKREVTNLIMRGLKWPVRNGGKKKTPLIIIRNQFNYLSLWSGS